MFAIDHEYNGLCAGLQDRRPALGRLAILAGRITELALGLSHGASLLVV